MRVRKSALARTRGVGGLGTLIGTSTFTASITVQRR